MLTSRERLNQTLNHEEPEQLVVDMGATSVSGINANALARLRDALGLEKKKIKIHEPLQLLGQVEEDVRQALHLDVVEVTGNYNIFGFCNEGRKPWTMQSGLEVDVPLEFNTTVDEKGRTYIYPQGDMSVPPSGMMPKGGFFFDNITRGNIAPVSGEAVRRLLQQYRVWHRLQRQSGGPWGFRHRTWAQRKTSQGDPGPAQLYDGPFHLPRLYP